MANDSNNQNINPDTNSINNQTVENQSKGTENNQAAETKGNSTDNRVVLTNYSKHKGVVTADAVRFGGGMGNILRGMWQYPPGFLSRYF